MGKRGRPPHPDILTPREWEVLELLRDGLSNPEIAERLGIGREGVKYHVSEILGKLGVASREEAARWSGPATEERRPWWSAAMAPAAWVSRRAGTMAPGKLAPAAMALSVAAVALLLAGLALIAFLLLRVDGGNHRPTTELVSVNSAGEQGNGDSRRFALSADGRYVAFESFASNLAPGEPDPTREKLTTDVFVHDRQTGITELVSVGTDGLARGGSASLAISAHGRYVAFCAGTALVPGDTNTSLGVLVRDRESGSTELVSVSSAGAQGDGVSCFPAMSADGRYVAFVSYAANLVPGDTNEVDDIFVHDRETGITERVSIDSDGNEANKGCIQWRGCEPVISADGRFVAFPSGADNLVPGDTNSVPDVFVHDRESGVTERVSVGVDGSQLDVWSMYPSISGSGQFVAFLSSCFSFPHNLEAESAGDFFAGPVRSDGDCPGVYVRDRWAGTTERTGLISPERYERTEGASKPEISVDGRYVAIIMGTHATDLYIHDRESGNTKAVITVSPSPPSIGSVDDNRPSMSADGRYIAFWSGPPGGGGSFGPWEQIYVYDRRE